MEQKIKYLEIVQNIISRMNSNSFKIKGWGITIVSALLAIGASESNNSMFYISLFPIFIFWGLDAYYLSIERKYRGLYNEIIKNERDIDFSLSIKKYEPKSRWIATCFSISILGFYLSMIIIMSLIIYFIK